MLDKYKKPFWLTELSIDYAMAAWVEEIDNVVYLKCDFSLAEQVFAAVTDLMENKGDFDGQAYDMTVKMCKSNEYNMGLGL